METEGADEIDGWFVTPIALLFITVPSGDGCGGDSRVNDGAANIASRRELPILSDASEICNSALKPL